MRVHAARSQSAMEYLMTYGWAVLIIGVVLAALVSLGAFNSALWGPRASAGSCKTFRSAVVTTLEGVCNNVIPRSVAQFSGTSSYVTTPPENTGASSFSVSFYFYATPVLAAGHYETVISNQYPDYNNNLPKWTVYLDARSYPTLGPLELRLNDGSQLNDITPESSVSCEPDLSTVNTWHFVAITVNSASKTYNFYADGNACGSGTYTFTGTFVSSNGVIISDASSPSFSGDLADVQIYNTSLDANQVQALYVEGIGGVPVNLQHIVGWWPLNGDFNDYSGGGNTGTPTNVVFTSSWTSGYTTP
ncbi:MAG: LamG domain-containing protein [Candidatus Micrarchaeaceae archaeon]|nr:LamG domain-containing protein [Candidatus Micrarchaeota archaeon]